MEFAVEAAKEGGKWLSSKATKHYSYAAYNGKYVEKLEKEVFKLENKKIEVDRRVKHSKDQGEVIIPRVCEWKNQAEELIQESYALIEKRRNSDAKCCSKLCHDIPYLYKSSKECMVLHKKVSDAYTDAMSFHEVAIPQLLPIIVPPTARYSKGFESRDILLAQIVDALQCDEINVIAVHGIGGVGKTTLVDKLLVQATEKNLFDIVVKAVVSRTPKIEDIQNQIADRINLQLRSQSVQGRVDELHRVLSEKLEEGKMILVILDDIWEALDFTAQVGIPSIRGCKIVITSRDKDCLNVGPLNVDKFIEVGVLEKNEATSLFNESLGDYSHTTRTSHQFEALYQELLGYCGGLPLALVTLAGVLKGKDYHYWKDTADKLSKHSTKGVKGMYEKVGSTIELSFHALQCKEAKMLFLLCSIFPEDELIEVDKLMSCGLAVELFEDVETLDKAMARVYTLIDQLKSCSLLIATENHYGKYCVQMHDVTRDVAKNIASSKEYNIFEGRSWPTQEDLSPRPAVCYVLGDEGIDDEYIEIASGFDGCHYPQLQILCLRYWSTGKTHCFEGMEKLKVLDMSIPWFYLDFDNGPSAFQPLKILRTLHLTIYDVGSISVIGQLTSLEFLYIEVGRLEVLPKAFMGLTRLKVLDLSKCYKLIKIPAGIIPSLSRLEGLFTGCRIKLYELEHAYHLKALCATLSVTHHHHVTGSILNNLFSFNMSILGSSTCIGVHPCGNEAKLLSKSFPRGLHLEDINMCGPVHFLRMTKLWKGLQVLSCRNVAGLCELISSRVIDFSCLRSLKFQQCDDMKHLLASQVLLPKLECLVLRYLQHFEGIWRQSGNLWKSCFPALRELHLDGLPMITYCTTASPSQVLLQAKRHLFGIEDLLQALELLRISSLECEEIWHCSVPVASFLKLHTLEVFDCQELERIIPFSQPTMMPDLQTIHVVNCKNLKEVIEYRDMSNSISLLSQLITLDLAFLPQPRHLFPSLHAFTGLVKLRVLKIVGCRNLEAVVSGDGAADSANINPIISSLQRVELRDLPCLKYFYSGTYTLEFPSLRWVRVLLCPHMKSFAPRSPTTKYLRRVILGYTPWEEISRWGGDLNTTLRGT